MEEEKEGEIVSNWTEEVKDFDDLGHSSLRFTNIVGKESLKKELLKGIYGYGFSKPSSIQQKGILPLLKKRDTISTGK